MEKNNILNEEVRILKNEHEIQGVRLCEEIELRKKAKEDKFMVNREQITLASRLDEKTSNE